MSSIARRVSPWFTRLLTASRTRSARRGWAELRRRMAGEPRRVGYFHQVDDPYSHLASQLLAELRDRYDVTIDCHLVGPPPDDAAPERERLIAWARRDAADVATGYGLEFPSEPCAPRESMVMLATRLLASQLTSGGFEASSVEIGRALWQGDAAGLDAIAARIEPASADATKAAIQSGNTARERLGHYLGAMFYYGGEWYWGVDRLWHLERRLQAEGALRAGASSEPIARRPDPSKLDGIEGDRRIALEYYPSLRSPYTAIAMNRTFALADRLPVDLILRPVLPMVMRGLPVPARKRLYIVLDTKREADDAGEPFGNICDPVDRPVERCFSLHPWARKEGRDAELLANFTRASFSEGVDTGSDEGLRLVVERSGLSWDDARLHLDSEGWREELEANREQLFDLGLWGVPSYRILGADGEPDYCTWGQDRIWRVEEEIRRRLAAARS